MRQKLRGNLAVPYTRLMLIVSFFCLAVPWETRAQDADVGFPVQPAPEIRLTGVLEAIKTPQDSTFPVLSVLIDGQPWLLHVSQVEPVIPAYPAQEEMQKFSGLGLRLLAERKVFSALQAPEMHNRSVALQGCLRVNEEISRVSSVRAAEPSKTN